METNKELYDIYHKVRTEEPLFGKVGLGVYSNATALTGGIMLVGMNPSGHMDDPYGMDFKDCHDKEFWDPKHAMLGAYNDHCAYIDLFPFKNGTQTLATEDDEIRFRGKLLSCTYDYIEKVRPRLIIFANTSNFYWGFNKKYLWMGYKFRKIKSPLCEAKQRWGLYEIIGINPTDVNKNSTTTNLEHSLFLQYRQHTSRGKTVSEDRMLKFEDIKTISTFIDSDWEKTLY